MSSCAASKKFFFDKGHAHNAGKFGETIFKLSRYANVMCTFSLFIAQNTGFFVYQNHMFATLSMATIHEFNLL